MKCAVIVAAYRTPEPWLRECIESIRGQEPLDGWEYELRIGVDGCEDTAATLDRMDEPYHCAPENVGPYLIRNSLVTSSTADAYAIFDADDRMHAAYLRTLIPQATPDGIAGSARRSIDAGGEVTRVRHGYVNGVCVLSHAAWDKLGGYRPWRIAADHDLISRAKAMGVPVRKHGEPLYDRRHHPESLTARSATHLRSKARKDRKRESRRAITEALIKRESLRVEPECAVFAEQAVR